MSIIICPLLTKFAEFEMLSSMDFIKAKHRIVSIKIRNHTHNAVKSSLIDTYELPAAVSIKNVPKKFNQREHCQSVIRITETDIEQRNGIEVWQAFIKKKFPKYSFYVLELITETTSGDKHTCHWKRKKGFEGQNIWTIRLIKIDGKKIKDHYTEREIYKIIGNLYDDECRLEILPGTKERVLCTPVLR